MAFGRHIHPRKDMAILDMLFLIEETIVVIMFKMVDCYLQSNSNQL